MVHAEVSRVRRGKRLLKGVSGSGTRRPGLLTIAELGAILRNAGEGVGAREGETILQGSQSSRKR